MAKNQRFYIPPRIDFRERQWPSREITESPMWCSVDLRDGNQALPNPMNPKQKREYFALLTQIGFKEIEVGFPSASEDDFTFTRELIEENRIPDDVLIMVLTQCRGHLIEKTFEAIQGIQQAIFHAYCATSNLHMENVFGMTKVQVLQMVVRAIRQIREGADVMSKSNIRLEFSPEEFTDTDINFTLETCEAVFEEWRKASIAEPLILNLPATVERRTPDGYADLIEMFCARFSERNKVTISLHAHNDQGMAVAATELALRAGADRVEGTLFGHGERTGNVDLVTLACNLQFRGIETGLDFSNLPEIVKVVERLTGMSVSQRHPYAGELVTTAFAGSHQDAIRKGMPDSEKEEWRVPYLHFDPREVGRTFQPIIRINTQSGKGGAVWVLETQFGIHPPKAMHPEIGVAVQDFAERVGREITPQEVYNAFMREFSEGAKTPYSGPYHILGYWPHPDRENPEIIHGKLRILVREETKKVKATGNGPIAAFVNCLRELEIEDFEIEDYHEQAIASGSNTKAIAFVSLRFGNTQVFGVEVNSNIVQAAVRAIVAALNRHANNKRR